MKLGREYIDAIFKEKIQIICKLVLFLKEGCSDFVSGTIIKYGYLVLSEQFKAKTHSAQTGNSCSRIFFSFVIQREVRFSNTNCLFVRIGEIKGLFLPYKRKIKWWRKSEGNISLIRIYVHSPENDDILEKDEKYEDDADAHPYVQRRHIAHFRRVLPAIS